MMTEISYAHKDDPEGQRYIDLKEARLLAEPCSPTPITGDQTDD